MMIRGDHGSVPFFLFRARQKAEKTTIGVRTRVWERAAIYYHLAATPESG
jgi:hypothetical protein